MVKYLPSVDSKSTKKECSKFVVFINNEKAGCRVHARNPNTLEVEAGKLRVQDHPPATYQFWGSLGYMKPCLIKPKTNQTRHDFIIPIFLLTFDITERNKQP